MACFAAPAAAAIITGIVRKKIPAQYHLNWLIAMFWGGVIMLIVDHIATGEIVFYPPFLTAMENPHATRIMVEEIITIGSAMTAAIIAAWAIIVIVANASTNRKKNQVAHI